VIHHTTLIAAEDVTRGIPGNSLTEASLFAEVISDRFPCKASEALADDGLGALHTPSSPLFAYSRWDAMVRPSLSTQGLQRASGYLLLSLCKAALESGEAPLQQKHLGSHISGIWQHICSDSMHGQGSYSCCPPQQWHEGSLTCLILVLHLVGQAIGKTVN